MFPKVDTRRICPLSPGATVQLRILGPVQMTVHEEEVSIATTKARGLLGVLAYKCNDAVTASYLADALWDADGPPDPSKTLQTHVSRLRRALKRSAAPALVHNNGHGAYRLNVDPIAVDYQQFVMMVREGHRALGHGDHKKAADLFATAVGLWRGPPLADLKTSWARRLQEALTVRELLPAQCALFDAKLALGAHEFVLDRLRRLLSDHPHENRLAELWMQTLAAANRSSEVDAFFRDFCLRLKVDLGSEPSPTLVQVYRSSSNRSASIKQTAQAVRVPRPPRDTPSFTGRAELLIRLDELLTSPNSASPVVALYGQPGVGKTALIRRWAYSRRAHFPHGMLHMDLAGYSGTRPVEPGTVMGMFLDELGVPADRIRKMGVDDRIAVLRSILTDRRVLVILDNVRDSQHARPLLAATANCPVVVTSRQRLTSLAVHDGAEHITVTGLTTAEAINLLRTRVGQRAVDEPDAVTELVALCDRLPLAICIAGEHIAARPEVSVRDLIDELRQTQRLLDAGAHGEDRSSTLRSAFSWSYHALKAADARLFRLLGLLPGVRFSVEAATAVSGAERPATDESLDALVGAHLIEQEGAGRFRVHDLLHLYAADRGPRDEATSDHDQAMRRLLGWYVESARNARQLLTGDPHDVPKLPAPEFVDGVSFDAQDQAKRWFELERANLVTLTRRAAEIGRHEAVWRLAACLNVARDHDVRELLEVHELGRASAAAIGDQAAVGGCLTNMGTTYARLDDHVQAGRCFEQAYQAFRDAGDSRGEAVSQHNLGAIYLKIGKPAEAIKWHRQALAAFSTANDEWAIANVQRWLGDDYRKLDKLDEANRHYVDSLHLSQSLRDHRGQGATLGRLAQLNLDIGRPDLAIKTGQSGLDAHDRAGDRDGAAEILCILAIAHSRLSAHSAAIANATIAAQSYSAMRNTARHAYALEILAQVYASAGENDHARDAWASAATILENQHDPRAADIRALADLSIEHPVPTPRDDLAEGLPEHHSGDRRVTPSHKDLWASTDP
jgi:DNA-binding SARP family transcriptional activator/tetratricopeptide (TPR) repeat protein